MHLLRDLLSTSGWVERTRDFAGSLRRSTVQPGGLLLVGTPEEEPWHLAAHLDDEARFSGVLELSPTLVRYAPPPDAPPHLAVGLDRLQAVSRGETLFVVAPTAAPEQLLERVADAKRIGATILSIDDGDDDLADLAHDRLIVPKLRARCSCRSRRDSLHRSTSRRCNISSALQPVKPTDTARCAIDCQNFLNASAGPAPER